MYSTFQKFEVIKIFLMFFLFVYAYQSCFYLIKSTVNKKNNSNIVTIFFKLSHAPSEIILKCQFVAQETVI